LKALLAEIDHNFAQFGAKWPTDLEAVRASLAKQEGKYRGSYRRLTTLQAWRGGLLESEMSDGSLAFFLEAQNDALISHVMAGLGSWRASLQALRSVLENAVFSLYYKDHPVELEQWGEGRHRLGFAATVAYLEDHPRFKGFNEDLTGVALAKAEYSTLSKAVHGSAKAFRMTAENSGTQLWNDQLSRLGAWITRERSVMTAVNSMFLTMFRAKMTGAALPNLRKSVSLAIPVSKHAAIKEKFGLSLFNPKV
jgi:hypothetical protein